MRKILILALFAIICTSLYSSTPFTKKLLETELPEIWKNVKEVYVWHGEIFKEFEIKKSPASKGLCKILNISDKEIPFCNYLFDADGNKTNYFLAHTFAETDSIPITAKRYVHKDSKEAKELEMFFVSVYEEKINEKGDSQILRPWTVYSGTADRLIFLHFTGEKKKTIFGDQLVTNEYELIFSKDKSKVFLHLIAED